MIRARLLRRFGTPAWDVVLRGTGVIALAAIPLTLLVPHAGALTAFVLITIWVHGPVSPLLPAAYEPTLMLFGRLYEPLFIALVGVAANLYIEFLDYHLFKRLGSTRIYRRLIDHPWFARATRWFAREPFFTTWLFAWSPLPFWMVRMLAPAAGYSVSRYLAATALGRLPRYWLFAFLGRHVEIPAPLLIAVAAGSLLVMVLLIVLRRRRRQATTLVRLEESPCGL